MGINHTLEKLAREGWLVTLYPRGEKGFYAQAEKDGKQIAVFDEYSPANTIKMLEERIYDDNAVQQSVQADLPESCDCDRSSLHDCVCPQCRERWLASR